MMDRFFDCLNVSNRKEWQEKQKDFLKPYESVDDIRVEWLDSFLLYFEWLDSFLLYFEWLDSFLLYFEWLDSFLLYFEWLDSFLLYFERWKESIQNRDDSNYTAHARSNIFISWQTHEGIQITVHSFKEVCKFLLEHGVPYILSERFCQDDLENYFGRQRAIGSRHDNPTVRCRIQ